MPAAERPARLSGRVRVLFDAAFELSPDDRERLIAGLAPADQDLRAELVALLDAHQRAAEFLEHPPLADLGEGFDPHHHLIGQRLGTYRIERLLGQGGMGTVFLAQRADGAYEQRVAIKLLDYLEEEPRSILRFERERQTLAKLTHPNIARLLDGGSTDDGIPFLVMEYVEGEHIDRYCDRLRLGVDARLRLFLQVCAGVQHAHRHLVVHRDLKPSNILVSADGEVKLLDFGIAKLLGELDREADREASPTAAGVPAHEAPARLLTLTVPGARAFTPGYASPEQLRGEEVSAASDVFALGLVLHELLVGAHPYSQHLEDLSAMSDAILGHETPMPSIALRAQGEGSTAEMAARRSADLPRLRQQIQGDLDAILLKALAKEEAKRYASAGELASDLARHLDHRPVEARAGERTYVARKFVRRHRFGSAAAVLALSTIVAAAGVALWQAREARRGADDMRRINAFLLDVLSLSDPFDAGSELTLSEALDGAAESIDERFADRPDLSADIRFGIGYSMLSRYRLEAAEKQLTRALRESETAFGADDSRTLRVLEGIAGLRHEQGRTREAEALYQRALARIEASGQQADPLYVLLLNNLGNLYLMREDFPQSDAYLRRALAESDRQQDEAPGDRGNMLNNLAQAAHGLEDLERADTLYRQAQRELEALFPEGSPDLAVLLNNRAHLAEGRDDRESLALHRQSLAMRQLVFGGDHPMVVTALASVARMSAKLGDASTALSNAQAAATMADRVYTEPNSRHASVHATLAEVRLASGDIAGAAQALQRAQSLLATVETLRPTVVDYLERVRTALCKDPAAPTQVCARATAAVRPG